MEYEELVSKLGKSNFDSIIKRKYLRNVKSNLKKIEEGLKQAKDVELLAAYKVLEKG